MPIISAVSSGSMRPFGFTYGAKPVFTDTTLAAFRYLDAYSDGVQASGTAPILYSISSGSLPSGLTLNQNTGAITGSTTATGSYNFTIQARNHLGVATQAFSMSVPAAPLPPTLVSAGGYTNGQQNISVSMPPHRAAGDVAILTYESWETQYFANQPENANPAGWTNSYKQYSLWSVIQDDGNTIYTQVVHRATWYRVMTGTSADDFAYVLPQSLNVTLQWICVRPAAGMTFTASGNALGGQTGGPSIFGSTFPPGNSWQVLTTFSANVLPKTIVIAHDPLGMTINSGPSHVAGTAPSAGWQSTVSNTTAAVQSNYSQYTRSYITGLVDSSANCIAVGRFSKDAGANWAYNNSWGILTWSRV